MLRHVRENSVLRTDVCREMDKSNSEQLLELRGTHGLTIAPFGGDVQDYTVTDLLKALRNSGHTVPQQVTSAAIAQR
jgi:hypothetical protein